VEDSTKNKTAKPAETSWMEHQSGGVWRRTRRQKSGLGAHSMQPPGPPEGGPADPFITKVPGAGAFGVSPLTDRGPVVLNGTLDVTKNPLVFGCVLRAMENWKIGSQGSQKAVIEL
jgi:hypothetical protein